MKTLSILGVIGPLQAVLIIVVIILIFGGKKIPGLVKGIMQGIKDFKKELNENNDNDNKVEKE